MPEMTQGPIAGSEYRFLEDGFTCKDWSGLIRYEDITEVANVPGNCCFEISFNTAKGKTRRVEAILDGGSQIEPLRALFLRKIPGASAHTRPQTAWEAVKGWVTLGVLLAAFVGLVIALNTWGRGTSVVAPIWAIPFLMIGSFLSTTTLLAIIAAILAICGVGAAVSLGKRKTVWVISRKK